MATAQLTDRGVIRVGGEEAKTFLDGLVTCDIDRIAPGQPRFGALLSPQGKILFDFIIHALADESGPAFLMDCTRAFAPDLVKRLSFYRLRAKVTLEDVSDRFAVLAGLGEGANAGEDSRQGGASDSLNEHDLIRKPVPTFRDHAAPDPRLAALGWRAVVARDALPAEDDAEGEAAFRAYHAHRIALGVPEAGKDFLFTEAFPHEALMDQLNGVDFDKGCYVGQEVVSRMQHRGTARTRILPIAYVDGFVAEAGLDVTAGEKRLGATGTASEGRGLAMLRLDRVGEAVATGETIRAGGLPIRVEPASWTRFALPPELVPATAS